MALTPDDISKIQDMIEQRSTQDYRSGKPRVPPHQHDGIDNLRINEKNLIYNNKFQVFIRSSTPGNLNIIYGNATTIDSLNIQTGTEYTPMSVSNPTHITFLGFAANNNGVDPTDFSIITGIAELGNCYIVDKNGVTGTLTNTNIIQCSNSLRTFTVSGAPIVIADPTSLASVINSSNDFLVRMNVTSFTAKTVSVHVFADTGWIIEGSIVIT